MTVVGRRLSRAGGVRDRIHMARRCLCNAGSFGWRMHISMCEHSFFLFLCAGVVHAMFAEMLIHFCFGKFLHVYHPYVLLLGEVMPIFFRRPCICICCDSN